MSPVTEPSALRRLGRFCYRHHWRVLVVWIVGIVVLTGLSGAMGDDFSQLRRLRQRGHPAASTCSRRASAAAPARSPGHDRVRRRAGRRRPRGPGGHGGDLRRRRRDRRAARSRQSPYDQGGECRSPSRATLAGQLAFANVTFPSNIDWSDMAVIAEDVEALLPAGAPGDQGDGLARRAGRPALRRVRAAGVRGHSASASPSSS